MKLLHRNQHTHQFEVVIECEGHYHHLCKECEKCTPDYDRNNFPCNYDCGYYKERKEE